MCWMGFSRISIFCCDADFWRLSASVRGEIVWGDWSLGAIRVAWYWCVRDGFESLRFLVDFGRGWDFCLVRSFFGGRRFWVRVDWLGVSWIVCERWIVCGWFGEFEIFWLFRERVSFIWECERWREMVRIGCGFDWREIVWWFLICGEWYYWWDDLFGSVIESDVIREYLEE